MYSPIYIFLRCFSKNSMMRDVKQHIYLNISSNYVDNNCLFSILRDVTLRPRSFFIHHISPLVYLFLKVYLFPKVYPVTGISIASFLLKRILSPLGVLPRGLSLVFISAAVPFKMYFLVKYIYWLTISNIF